MSTSVEELAPVAFGLDHNRIIVPVEVYSSGGKHRMVKAWLDNGNPTMSITGQLAEGLGLTIATDSAGDHAVQSPDAKIGIGGILFPMAGLPVEVEKEPSLGGGLDAEITLPSTLLRHYEVIVDYPSRQLTIGTPGAVHFEGIAVKCYVHPENGLIQIPAVLDDDSFQIALDLGTPVSLVSRETCPALLL